MLEEINEKKYEEFIDEIKKKKAITVATLGPKGTSSYMAFNGLYTEMKGHNNELIIQLRLENSFDIVLDLLNDGDIDYALIPAAYEKITEFFWNSSFCNLYNYFYDTPKYGVVKRRESSFAGEKTLKVASCPAVEKLIDKLQMIKALDGKDFIKITTHSTMEAATLLVAGDVDVAVTNETSYNQFSDTIEFISEKQSSQMLWCLFKKR